MSPSEGQRHRQLSTAPSAGSASGPRNCCASRCVVVVRRLASLTTNRHIGATSPPSGIALGSDRFAGRAATARPEGRYANGWRAIMANQRPSRVEYYREYRLRNSERLLPFNAKRQRDRIAKQAPNTSCAICLKPIYRRPRKEYAQSYSVCGPRCLGALNRRLLGGRSPVPVDQRVDGNRRALPRGTHDTLYERDRQTCHICKKLVERRDASADHLVPVIFGGSNRESNLALAHRRCNSRRNAGRIPAQLRLGEPETGERAPLQPLRRLNCRHCGDEFIRARNTNTVYCSPSCRDAYWVAKRSSDPIYRDYQIRWRAARREIKSIFEPRGLRTTLEACTESKLIRT